MKLSLFRLKFGLVVILFRILLDISYITYVAPYHSYMGLDCNLNIVKLIESYFLLSIMLCVVTVEAFRPSDVIMTGIFFFFIVVPSLSFFSMSDESRIYTYFVLLSYLTVDKVRRIPIKLKVKLSVKNSHYAGIFVSIVCVFFVLIWIAYQKGFRFFNLDLWSVYDLRRQAAAAISSGIMGYLDSWVFKVFNVSLIAWFIMRKSIFLTGFFLLVQVLFFAISNHKSVLFFPFLVILIYWAFREKQKDGLLRILYALISLVAFSWIIDFSFGIQTATTLITRRIFYIPVMVNYVYYKFFDANGFVYLSNSVLSGFFDYPFSDQPSFIIGKIILGRPGVNAGSGYLGSAFMHFGFLGMIAFSMIIGLILGAVDSLWKSTSQVWFPSSIVLIPFFSLILSADLSVALLTHGLMISVLLLWTFSDTSYRRESNRKRWRLIR